MAHDMRELAKENEAKVIQRRLFEIEAALAELERQKIVLHVEVCELQLKLFDLQNR